MLFNYRLLLPILAILTISGCNGKSFTLQSYADEYFNDKKIEKSDTDTKPIKEKLETKEEDRAKEKSVTKLPAEKSTESKSATPSVKKESNPAIKKGVGADVAWSSTYKQDEKMQGQGGIQKSLDKWNEEEWEPAFKNDVNQSAADEKANEHFTIQHYVDKVGNYLEKKKEEEKGKPQEPAHYEKINDLPVIGE